MPDLSSFFSTKLPTIFNSELGAVKDKAISYSMADPRKLVGETVDKISASFGDIKNPFGRAAVVLSKIGAKKPTELQASATSIKAGTGTEDGDESTSHKVKLEASVADGESIAIQNSVNFVHEPLMERVVEFDAMPEVQEIHSAEYEALAAPQMPLEFQKYKGTKSIQWQINGTFTCRTRNEAARNYIYLNNLRGWTKPYFGEEQRKQFGGDNGNRGKLGAPPPVLKFSGWRGLVGPVPVVVTSLNWNWPKDCDWIPTGMFDPDGKEIPFPTVMNINIALVESFSPEQVNAFDLVAFRNGDMIGAWRQSESQPARPEVSEALGSNGGNQSTINGTAQASTGGPTATTADFSNEGRNARLGRLISQGLSSSETLIQARAGRSVDEESTTEPIIDMSLG
jgi:hypothetical protein